MNVIDEPRHGIRIGIRPDAVPEIENVAGTSSRIREHCISLDTKLRRRCKERRRIKIPLYGLRRAQNLAIRGQGSSPVHADHIDIKLRHGLHECRTLIGVVNDRNLKIAQGRHRALHRRQCEAPILLEGQKARPGRRSAPGRADTRPWRRQGA